jgi:hypothetical protein
MRKLFYLLLSLLLSAPVAHAQQRPFLYTLALPSVPDKQLLVHFDAGWGEGGLGFSEGAGIDRRLGVQWRASRWWLLGNVGFGKDHDSERSVSGQTQVLYVFRDASQHGFVLAAGGGLRFEREGGTVGLFQAVSGWRAPAWRFDGNLTLEKASQPGRDPLDVILSVGWSHQVYRGLSLGVEALGQDLEGFWDPLEAEGGARILLGPSLHLTAGAWEGGIAGGYVFRPTVSPLSSPADRQIGLDRYAIQVSLGRAF